MMAVPPWMQDQFGAATRETKHSLGAAGLQTTTPAEHPEWSALGGDLVVRGLTRFAEAGGQYCPHIASGPQPIFLLLWKPDRIMCARCMAIAVLETKGSDDDVNCDHCGHPSPDGMIHPIGAHAGPMSVLGGVCTTCAEQANMPKSS